MKRILATLLAIVFVIGMASNAAAAETTQTVVVNNVFELEDTYGNVSAAVPTEYIAGETLYYALSVANSTTQLQQSDFSNYDVNWRINDGGIRIKKVFLTMKQNEKGESRAYLAVKLKETYQNGTDTLVDAEITIAGKNGCKVTDKTRTIADTYTLPLRGEALYGVTEEIGSGPHPIAEPIVSFSANADNVTLCFDSNIEVSGNMQGEKNMFLRLSASNDELQSIYPNAQLRLFDGNRKTFQRPVTIKIPIAVVEGKNGKPAKPYLYELRSAGLVDVENSTYSFSDEMFIITTKTLGNYIISDEELEITTDQRLTEPETTNPEQWALPDYVEENPQTGGALLLGLCPNPHEGE